MEGLSDFGSVGLGIGGLVSLLVLITRAFVTLNLRYAAKVERYKSVAYREHRKYKDVLHDLENRKETVERLKNAYAALEKRHNATMKDYAKLVERVRDCEERLSLP